MLPVEISFPGTGSPRGVVGKVVLRSPTFLGDVTYKPGAVD